MEDGYQEYLRQQERERFLRQQQESTPDVRLLPEASGETDRLPGDESPCFPIERILLTGEGAEQLQWALGFANRTGTGEDDPALHRCLGTRGINLAMSRIQNGLVGRGFVTTRVLAEPQDVSTGTLRLTVIPGRIRTIRFAEGTDARATGWNAMPARPGDLLNLRDIEQALENFKRVPTVEADIQITPAEDEEALARNLRDLEKLVARLNEKGVAVRFVKEGLTFGIGDESPITRLQLQMMGAFAQFERALIKERQREGIAIAKAKGKHLGRNASLSSAQVEEIRARVAAGESKAALAKEYGVSRPTLYAALKDCQEVEQAQAAEQLHDIVSTLIKTHKPRERFREMYQAILNEKPVSEKQLREVCSNAYGDKISAQFCRVVKARLLEVGVCKANGEGFVW